MQLQDNGAAQLASASLVGLAGISKTVAQHHLPRRQRRKNDFPQMLRTGSEHQGKLSVGIQPQRPHIKQKLADALSSGSTAGFPGRDDRQSPAAQNCA